MKNNRDPQNLGGSSDMNRINNKHKVLRTLTTEQKISYLRRQGVTVIFDSFGVRLQQVSFRDRNKRFKSWRVNRIWCETLDEAWVKFLKKKWD